MSSLPARTGWQWLKQGFALFRKQPGILTMLLFANLAVSLVISAVPLLGPVMATLLIPSFSMAMMQACRIIEQGQRVVPAVLLTGFRQPAVVALCKLGLVYLAVALLLMGVMALTISPEFWKKISAPVAPGTAGAPQVDGADLMTLMIIVGVQSAMLLALCFSAPLTYWKKMSPGKATFYSVFGVLGAAKPMFTMLAAWFGIYFTLCLAMTLILGAGNAARALIIWLTLLFILLLQCALYVAYRQIFGEPAEGPVSLDK